MTAGQRLLGWIRLPHPFPSVLDGLVSGAVALVAGGPPDVAVRIGLAMTLLQLGIGTVNDVVDAPRDAGRKAGKPIPAGLVDAGPARVFAIACFVGGTILAVVTSLAVGLLALVVIAVGLAYDLRLKGTAWSWLPFAIGIPILPVFGWAGTGNALPAAFFVLLPVAVGAGAALAVGNTLVDVERDRAAGVASVATILGTARSVRVAAALFAVTWAAAVASAMVAGASGPAVGAIALVGGLPVVAVLRSGGGSPSPAVRERAWQIEAVSLAVLAALWLTAVLGRTGSPG